MSHQFYHQGTRVTFAEAMAGIQLRETVSFDGEKGVPIHFCKFCRSPLRNADLRDHLARQDRLETKGYLEEWDEAEPCERCWDKDRLTFEFDRFEEEYGGHPLNELPNKLGHRVSAFFRRENSMRERKLDMWGGTRVSSNESRTHSRTKKPWRRGQRYREFEKNLIPSLLVRADENTGAQTEEYLDEEQLHEDLYASEIYSEVYEDENGYLPDYDYETGYSDHFSTDCACTYCRSVALEADD